MGETWVRLAWLTNTGNVTQHSSVHPVAEALFGGAAADTSWPAWNNAWRSILMPAAYASTKSVKGYEMLATSSLDKSTLSLEVERSFKRAVTLVPSSMFD